MSDSKTVIAWVAVRLGWRIAMGLKVLGLCTRIILLLAIVSFVVLAPDPRHDQIVQCIMGLTAAVALTQIAISYVHLKATFAAIFVLRRRYSQPAPAMVSAPTRRVDSKVVFGRTARMRQLIVSDAAREAADPEVGHYGSKRRRPGK